jgi:hypothetical protein
MILNSHSEVFNSYILEDREMPFSIYAWDFVLQNNAKNWKQTEGVQEVDRKNFP